MKKYFSKLKVILLGSRGAGMARCFVKPKFEGREKQKEVENVQMIDDIVCHYGMAGADRDI